MIMMRTANKTFPFWLLSHSSQLPLMIQPVHLEAWGQKEHFQICFFLLIIGKRSIYLKMTLTWLWTEGADDFFISWLIPHVGYNGKHIQVQLAIKIMSYFCFWFGYNRLQEVHWRDTYTLKLTLHVYALRNVWTTKPSLLRIKIAVLSFHGDPPALCHETYLHLCM